MNIFAFTAKSQTTLHSLIEQLIPEDVEASVNIVTLNSGKKYLMVETVLSELDVQQIHRDMPLCEEVAYCVLPQ